MSEEAGADAKQVAFSSGNEPMLLWSVQAFCVAVQSRPQVIVRTNLSPTGWAGRQYISGKGQASRDNCTASVVGLSISITVVRKPLRQSDIRLPPDVHNILVVYAHHFLSLRALDPRVTERTRELRWRLR